MNYISAEEFLKQPEKVRKALIEWWQENIKETDLVGYIGKTPIYQRRSPWIVKNVDLYCLPIGTETIPLFTEEQLRKLIIDKGYKQIGINNYLELETWGIKVFKSMMQLEPDMEFYCDTPLSCYWNVACQIAKDI